MISKFFGLAVATAVLAACTNDAAPAQSVHKQLLVSGPEAGVRRFTALQNSRRPALKVIELTFRIGQGATAVVTLPADFSGQELVQTTREALAAGLDYQFREVRSMS